MVSGLADKAGVSAEQTANMFDGPESHIVWMYDKLKSWQQTQTLANKAFEGINTLAAADEIRGREPAGAMTQSPREAIDLPRKAENIIGMLDNLEAEKKHELISIVNRALNKRYVDREIRAWAKGWVEGHSSQRAKTGPSLEESLSYMNSAVRLCFENFTGGLFPVQLVTIALLVESSVI